MTDDHAEELIAAFFLMSFYAFILVVTFPVKMAFRAFHFLTHW